MLVFRVKIKPFENDLHPKNLFDLLLLEGFIHLENKNRATLR